MHDPVSPALIALVVVFAGFAKGLTGMGLPAVTIGLLGLTMGPAEAAALILVPALITNAWQYLAGPSRLPLLRRLWPMLVAISIVTFAAAGLLAMGGAGVSFALGLALAAYATLGLARVNLSVGSGAEPWLSPVIGGLTGIVTGATGIFAIPAVPYLQAIGLDKEELVQALGLSFTISTLALAAGLARHGVLHPTAAGASMLCTVPALVGMGLGQAVRTRVDRATFRTIFLCGLLLLGADLMARAI